MILFSKKKSDIPSRRQRLNSAPKLNLPNLFKRNRTLSGVVPEVESSRTHVHHLSIKRRKLVGILLVTLLIIALLFAFIGNFTASVTVSVSDTKISKTIKAEDYRQVIQDYLNINPLSRFRFLLDQKRLNGYVKSKIPEVQTVIQNDELGLGSTNYSLVLRSPVASWRMNDKQYFVDSNGVAFENNYFSSPTVEIVDNSGVSLQPGTASVSKRFLGFVGLVVSLSKTSGYTVSQAILPVNTTRELDLKLQDINTLVKMSIDRPAGEQVEDMSRAVKYFKNLGETPTYIDVRVSGKAFYK